MLILQTNKKLFDSHSSMFIFSRKQLGISQVLKNIFNGNVTNYKTDPLVSITNSATQFPKNVSEQTKIKETKFNLPSCFQRVSKVGQSL